MVKEELKPKYYIYLGIIFVDKSNSNPILNALNEKPIARRASDSSIKPIITKTE